MFIFSRFLIILFIFAVFSSAEQSHAQNLSADHQKLNDALEKRLSKIDAEMENQKDSEDIILSLDFGGKILKEGDFHADIPLLRAKLMNFDIEESFKFDPHLYDSVLAKAVKQYQTKMGLKDDGVIGPSTLTSLNRTLEDEKKLILINLNRLKSPKWFDRPSLRIEVDVTRYWLKAYEDNEIVFEMPVVVGSVKRQTNIFSTVMTGVRLNPGWTVPPTIKTEDYIPKLRTDPNWLNEHGIKLYSSWDRDAEPVDPTTVDWSFLSDNDIRAMRFYKKAGKSNPLGLYRFLMSNKHDIYLHDTNKHYLFERSERARSSGCVRVSDPRRIVEFLMVDNPDWTSEKLDEVLEKGKTYNLQAKRSIPVYFDYKTAWMDKDNKLVLGRDIYGLDVDLDHGILVKNDGNLGLNQKKLEE